MKSFRRAFTLVELLAVIAIIALLATLLAGLRPGSPKGLDGATSQAQSMFALARAQAMLGNDPDVILSTAQKQLTPLKFIRTRVIILNDPTDIQNNLRRMGVILGGYRGTDPTKSELNLQESDLTWYAMDNGVVLPDGIYYVDVNNAAVSKSILRSDAVDKTFGAYQMKLSFPHRQAQTGGSGQNWYYYEFLASGAINMADSQNKTGARFMITQGSVNPASNVLQPNDPNVVGGFIILHTGNTVVLNKIAEAQ